MAIEQGTGKMIVTKKLQLTTEAKGQIIDITSDIAKQVTVSGISDGIVTIFATGSTAGITTIEYEPGLVADFNAMWEREIPQNINYEHDKAWGESNGHSHVRASLLGNSLTVPIADGKMTLGTWQQVVFIDFDIKPRTREIVLQIMGNTAS
jgi:secondary thiamine-phosphate synthase enzyme